MAAALIWLHGCPARADGCFDVRGDSAVTLSRDIWFRVQPSSRPKRVASVPQNSNRIGGSTTLESGKQHYPRARLALDEVEVQDRPDSPYRTVYRLGENGSLEVVEAPVTDTTGR